MKRFLSGPTEHFANAARIARESSQKLAAVKLERRDTLRDFHAEDAAPFALSTIPPARCDD